MTQIYSPSRPITQLGNFDLQCAAALRKLALSDTLPRLQNPLTKRGPLQSTPYWECYAPLTSFYALVNPNEGFEGLPSAIQTGMHKFWWMIQDLVPDATRSGINLMIAERDVEEHVDPPVRDLSINWYPFGDKDHTLVCGSDELVPHQGALILLDTRIRHRTIQPNGPIVFFSYSLHLKGRNDQD